MRARESIAGYRASYVFRPDANPSGRPTVFLIAVFDDDPDWADGAVEVA